MPTILFEQDARDAIQKGVSTLARTVRSTLGPRGRNVMIAKSFGPPLITKDGVTVAREIVLEDSYENVGAQMVRDAASTTNEAAGDGTTTATVLAHAIFKEGLKIVTAGVNSVQLNLGIQRCVRDVVENLRSSSIPVKDQTAMAQVASIAANNNLEIGNLIAETITKVGEQGVVVIEGPEKNPHVHEGLALAHKPYYAMCSYKIYHDERFDLFGNSLAILTGIASPSRSQRLIKWIEVECNALRASGDLVVDLPPCLFPYMQPGDPDWHPRYALHNQPGEYHNGGVWPFICGFYIAACVAAGQHKVARKNLDALASLVKPWHENKAEWGFNEQIKAQTGEPIGRDWQTWSAAMFLYAAKCVETQTTPWFDRIRTDVAPAAEILK